MDDLEFRRRVIAQWGISPDKYDGFDFGIVQSNKSEGGSWKNLPIKAATTPFIPVVAGHSIIWNDGIGVYTSHWQNAFTFKFYNADKTYYDYYGRTAQPRTLNVPSKCAYARFTINMDTIADAYLKDNTTGEYLWRGSDYV